MLDYLNGFSDMGLFALLSLISITVSIIAIFIVKQFIPLHVRYKDDPVLGNVSSLISIIYGLLVGLTSLYLINNISATEDSVQSEANSVANIYRESHWLKQPYQDYIKLQLVGYLHKVIEVDWPLMRSGKDVTSDGDRFIDHISDELRQYNLANNSDVVIAQDMLESIKTLYNARQHRIHLSYTSLNPDLWGVIVLGTILTICINYLFGMNFYLHIFTMTAAALILSSMIFLLITLDRPFQGEFVVEPTAFKKLLEYFQTPLTNTNKLETHHETI